jgi:hypothetical protein
MFLKQKYRDRAIGLVGAYAVLVAGVFASGALESPPETGSPTRTETKSADGCSSALQERSDSFC